MARNAWRLGYQLPIAAPQVGERLMRRADFTRRVLRSGWGDRDTWDEEAAGSYAAVQAQPQHARAGSLMYRNFLTRELGPLAARGLDGRLGVPARLVIGRRDPLGAQLADGFEHHGDDARAEVLEGCGHFVPEERPDAVADRARALFARA
jgi:pimeloyl-ACP methyl ester carboxylesterase